MIPLVRASAKRVAESLLVWSGVGSLYRQRMGGRRLILAYHNIVADGTAPCGDGSLHLARSTFAGQLDRLRRHHAVVPLERLLEPVSEDDRPRVAITFDDAYRGAVTLGVEELRQRGLPATLFVAPGRLGGQSFWWDVLGGGHGVAATVRQVALETLQGRDEVIRRWASDSGVPQESAPPALETATHDELERAAQAPGITLASHSWSHPNLAALNAQELEHELMEPLRWLQRHFESVIPWLAYPYGLASEGVRDAARVAGYSGALRISGGWLPQGARIGFDVPRLNVPSGLSPHGFTLRIAGLPFN